MIRSVIFLLAATIVLAGCALFGDDDNAEPPAELESFDKQVSLRSLWRRGTGDGTDEQRVKLVPAVVGERVYVADRSGSVWAYELDNGKILWRIDLEEELSTCTLVESVIATDRFLIVIGSRHVWVFRGTSAE